MGKADMIHQMKIYLAEIEKRVEKLDFGVHFVDAHEENLEYKTIAEIKSLMFSAKVALSKAINKIHLP